MSVTAVGMSHDEASQDRIKVAYNSQLSQRNDEQQSKAHDEKIRGKAKIYSTWVMQQCWGWNKILLSSGCLLNLKQGKYNMKCAMRSTTPSAGGDETWMDTNHSRIQHYDVSGNPLASHFSDGRAASLVTAPKVRSAGTASLRSSAHTQYKDNRDNRQTQTQYTVHGTTEMDPGFLSNPEIPT
jgi:hypothetical protein